MKVYTTRRFLGLLAASIVIAVAVVSFAPLAMNRLFPVTRVYAQLVLPNVNECPPGYHCSPASVSWPKLNHTLVITGNRVESFLEATAVEEPRPNPANITAGIGFNPTWSSYLILPPGYLTDADVYVIPVVVGGDVLWRGELHQGQSIEINNTLILPSDGRYFIGAIVLSAVPGGVEGRGISYYITVQGGTVTRVSSTPEYSDNLELKCLSNC